MSAKRVLLVSHGAQLGGAEYVMLDIVKHFGRDSCHVVLFSDGPLRGRLGEIGIGVTLLALHGGALKVTRNAGYVSVLGAVPSVLAVAFCLARLARSYDVLYANSQKAAVVGMLAGRLARKPVIWHLHDILSSEHFAGLQRRVVVAFANRSARRVIANSRVTMQSFVGSGGDPQRVVVVPIGIDPMPFKGIDALDVPAMRASAGLPPHKLVGLFGRIAPWKGQHVLVSALAELPDVHAVIVGDALFGEIEYKRALLSQAERLDVVDRIHWLGYRDDIPQLMRMVDIVVHTSVAPEPFGRVIIEGVLAGRPVLASNHGASRELLTEADWLVAPGDPTALARAIRSILGSPMEKVASAVTAMRERASRLFALSQMQQRIGQIVSACEEIPQGLGQRPARPRATAAGATQMPAASQTTMPISPTRGEP